MMERIVGSGSSPRRSCAVAAVRVAFAATPPNLGVCDIVPDAPGAAALEVELWSARAFAQQTAASTNCGQLQRLRGLGHGAFYAAVKGDTNDGNVLFERRGCTRS